MKSITTLLFLVASLHLVHAQNLVPQRGGNCFTLDLPSYMAKTYDLNEAASLQYQNILKEAYTIVIEDEKGNLEALGVKFSGARDFTENFLEDYLLEADNRKVGPIAEFKSNGNGHAQAELTWSEGDQGFYMLVTGVETSTHFYKVLCWTVLSNKDKLKDDYLAIAKSLKQ